MLINRLINTIDSYDYWTNSLGLGRSFIAFCTLLTLVFNNDSTLFILEENGNIIAPLEMIPNIFVELGSEAARIISYLVLISVIVGFYPQITSILHAYITHTFFYTSILIEGGDQIASIVSILIIPICLLDKRTNHWKIQSQNRSFYAKNIAFIFYTLISLQLTYLYFDAVVSKLSAREWINGTAVYYWWTDTTFGINDYLLNMFTFLLREPLFVSLLTWGALLIEFILCMSIFVVNKKMRFNLVWLGLFLHFSFAVSFGLISFFFAISGCLIIHLIGKYFILNKFFLKLSVYTNFFNNCLKTKVNYIIFKKT